MKTLGTPQPDSDVVNKEPSVLLIGYGWVGQYMGKYFKNAHVVDSEGIIFKQIDKSGVWTAEGAKKLGIKYDLAIIGVPTPMNPVTGQCDTSIVEKVVDKYKDIVDIFLIKSTVEIGTSKRLEDKYGVPVCMSPEYVGETLGHPLLESRKDAFQIIGGNPTARERVAGMFMRVLHASAPIHLVSHEEAELIKYSENLWIMQRVAYWNDIYRMCQKLGISFNAVREGLVLDPRFSRTHSNVYPENRGWSGKCLPKDMNGLVYKMRSLGLELPVIEKQIEDNAEVRKDYKNSVKLIPDEPIWKK